MKLSYITASYLIILSIYNTVTIIVKKDPLVDFILYAGVFLLFAVVIIIAQHFKVEKTAHGIMFLTFGVIGEIIGGVGLGIILFTYGIYYIGSGPKRTIAVTMLILATIFIRNYTKEYSVTLAFNYLFLHAYFFTIYYYTWHPKPVKLEHIEGLSYDQVKIIEYLIQGYTAKEISVKLEPQLSTNAVYKRIAYIREKHGYRTTEHMIYDLAKNGHLRQRL